jgi:branched-chain amino acid transport system ATP-binding protein
VTEEIFEAIDRLKAEGMTGILVEQNAHLALSVADRGFVLEVGNVVASGSAKDLRNDPRVLAAYIGAGDRYRDAGASGE